MCRYRQTIELNTELSINYIPCCSVVLMHYNMWYLINFCDGVGIDLEKELDKNISKLQVRFPEKFTKEKAINRDLDTERQILEQ